MRLNNNKICLSSKCTRARYTDFKASILLEHQKDYFLKGFNPTRKICLWSQINSHPFKLNSFLRNNFFFWAIVCGCKSLDRCWVSRQGTYSSGSTIPSVWHGAESGEKDGKFRECEMKKEPFTSEFGWSFSPKKSQIFRTIYKIFVKIAYLQRPNSFSKRCSE